MICVPHTFEETPEGSAPTALHTDASTRATSTSNTIALSASGVTNTTGAQREQPQGGVRRWGFGRELHADSTAPCQDAHQGCASTSGLAVRALLQGRAYRFLLAIGLVHEGHLA